MLLRRLKVLFLSIWGLAARNYSSVNFLMCVFWTTGSTGSCSLVFPLDLCCRLDHFTCWFILEFWPSVGYWTVGMQCLFLTHWWIQAVFKRKRKKKLYLPAICCFSEARWLKDMTFSSHWSFRVEEKECAGTDKSLTRKAWLFMCFLTFFTSFLAFSLSPCATFTNLLSGNLNPRLYFKVGFGGSHHIYSWRRRRMLVEN